MVVIYVFSCFFSLPSSPKYKFYECKKFVLFISISPTVRKVPGWQFEMSNGTIMDNLLSLLGLTDIRNFKAYIHSMLLSSGH